MKCQKVTANILSCLILLLVGNLAWGQSEHTAKLVEGAKKEGKLTWYTALNTSDSRRLLNTFEKKYPFVRTKLFRAGADRITNRVLTETRAGRWQFDVVSMRGINIDILVQHGLVSLYVSPEAKAFSQEFRDPAGYWTGIYSNYYVPGYNTTIVSGTRAPKKWEDLTDPRWKGKICIDQADVPWYATIFTAWGREKSEKYIKALANQDIQWRRGHTLIAQLMAAGEFSVAIVYAHRIEDMKKKGASVEWANTVDPVVVSVSGVGLSTRPNNPNTGKLFIDYVLSKEAQEMIRSFNRSPTRSDVEPLSPRMDPKKLKLKVVPQDLGTNYSKYAQEFKRLFGL